MTKNMTREGDLTLRGGVFRDKQWQDSITFKRKSWYLELTLAYDLMTAPASSESPFFNWFSKDEQKKINSCADARILLMYSWDTSKITYQEILMELEEKGYTSFAINGFNRQLKMHPNYNYHSLRLYGVWGICSKEKKSEIKLSIPGFMETTHKL
jgi:hypothetical protein